MLTRCLAAACVFALSPLAYAQSLFGENHLVDEGHAQVRLHGDVPLVSVPIRGLAGPYTARIRVEWLDPNDKATAAVERQISVPPEGLVFETPLSLPIKEPLLARLQYRLTPAAASLAAFPDQSGFIAFTEIAPYAYVLSVTTAPVSGPGEATDAHVIATNPKTGLPVPDVEISLGEAKARTEANGSATLRLSKEDLEASHGQAVKASFGGLVEEAEMPYVGNWPPSVKLSTDKHLYRPGQVLHMRLMASKGDGTAANKHGCTVAVRDRKDDTVFAADLTTSKFGVAHADWEIPAHLQSGEFAIKADCDDATSERQVQIRPYELPSFRVLAEPDRAFYLPGETSHVTVHAEYLFEKAMTAGHVRVSAFEEENGKKKAKPQVEDPPLAEGELDGQGRFVADVDLVDKDLFTVSAFNNQKQFQDLI